MNLSRTYNAMSTSIIKSTTAKIKYLRLKVNIVGNRVFAFVGNGTIFIMRDLSQRCLLNRLKPLLLEQRGKMLQLIFQFPCGIYAHPPGVVLFDKTTESKFYIVLLEFF